MYRSSLQKLVGRRITAMRGAWVPGGYEHRAPPRAYGRMVGRIAGGNNGGGTRVGPGVESLFVIPAGVFGG